MILPSLLGIQTGRPLPVVASETYGPPVPAAPPEGARAPASSATGGLRTYSDRLLCCVGCGKPFVFTASEQRFFVEKGLNVPPKRCLSCRRERKRGSGGASFSVTCARCWRPFTVPFPPRPGASFACEKCAAHEGKG